MTLTGSADEGVHGHDGGGDRGLRGINAGSTGSGAGTLTGEKVASTWALDGTPTYNDGAGNGDLSFSGFANLQGGTNVDTFNVTAASAFNLLGGAGADVFNIGATLTGSVNGEAGSGHALGHLDRGRDAHGLGGRWLQRGHDGRR